MSPLEHVDFFYELVKLQIDQGTDNFEKVLSLQEKDFMTAYRDHMSTIFKEINQLKKRVIGEKFEMNRSKKLQRMTDKCQWF